MTRANAVDWIRRLVATMKEETSGVFPEPEYKDDVYEALNMAIKVLEQESCEDVISRADAIKQIQRYGVGCFDPDEFSPETCERFVIDLLNNLPPYRIKSDDKEPTEGHLTLLTECSNSGYYCSKCHKKVAEERSDDVKKIKFCSKCGTKIAGEVEKL